MKDSTRWSALPNDVILTVAFFVPASSDFFAFLQAVRRFHRLPPLLERIWQLGCVKEHADLWPALKLSPVDGNLEQIYREAFQYVAKYYR
ncbi:hypothetical protein Ae201684P_016781 [Aphanomyces euteiches]|nr:hypothetical protein Ae201684P_016781 [Aphanomyces euteiches]